MKEKGILIVLVGIIELVFGISEGTFSTILMGLCFCIIGSLYFFEDRL